MGSWFIRANCSSTGCDGDQVNPAMWMFYQMVLKLVDLLTHANLLAHSRLTGQKLRGRLGSQSSCKIPGSDFDQSGKGSLLIVPAITNWIVM